MAAVGKIYTQSRDLVCWKFAFAYKKITKGMKWAAVGEICTQSRDSRCQDFTFAYKNNS